MAFSTWTPVEGVSDEWLWLNDEQKKKIVADLLHQRKIYGDFLLNTPAMAQKFGPEEMVRQTPDECKTAKFVPSFRADGSRIHQCIFSEKGDCSSCGCVITTALDNLTDIRNFDWETAKTMRRLLPPFKQAAKTIELAKA